MTELRKAGREAAYTCVLFVTPCCAVLLKVLLRVPERRVCWSDPDCILYGTPGAAARLFKEFAKANAKFEVKPLPLKVS